MHCEYFLLKGIMSQDFGPFFEKKKTLPVLQINKKKWLQESFCFREDI